jgi:ribosomal protein S27E
MDLNRLRVLAGLDPIAESIELNEAENIKKGAFHKWLGKPEDEAITDADVDRGLKSDDEHVRKMAQFAKNMRESVNEVEEPKVHELSFKCPECSHAWSIHAKVERDDECPKCGKVSLPKKNVNEVSAAKLAHRTHGDNPASEAAHDSDIPKVTFMEKPPANALILTQVEFDDDTLNFNKTKMGVDVEEETKVKVPSDVMKHINKRIQELKASIETYDEKGYDDKSVKSRAIECLEKIKKHLEAGTQEQYKQAQVYYGTLMSPIFDMFPTQLINFLHSTSAHTKSKI